MVNLKVVDGEDGNDGDDDNEITDATFKDIPNTVSWGLNQKLNELPPVETWKETLAYRLAHEIDSGSKNGLSAALVDRYLSLVESFEIVEEDDPLGLS